jgi:hypothetical protein
MNRYRAEIPTFSDAGCVALGELIRRDRLARFGSLEKLQARLAELGVKVSETTLQRLEKPPIGKRPDWEVLNAIAYLGFVVNPSAKRPFTTDELILVACEWMNSNGQILKQGASMTNIDNEFLQLLRSQFPTPYDLANASKLKLEEAIQIFAGKNPTTVEVGFLAQVFFKKNGDRWGEDELAEFCDSIYEPEFAEENPPTHETQEDHHEHEIGNGCS